MDLFDAEILAKTLISEFVPLYSFSWDNSKKRFGCCYYTQRTITMSRHLTPLRTNKAVQQTIMHEIAHALHPGDGHGKLWKAQMRAFGLPDARCPSDDVDVSSIANWRAGCKACGKVYYMIRKPRIAKACSPCYRKDRKNKDSYLTFTRF